MKGQQIQLKQSPSGMHSNWSGSRDNVRKIVEKEGRIARNLITWSVPVAEQRSQAESEGPDQRGRHKFRRRNRRQGQGRFERNSSLKENQSEKPTNESHFQNSSFIKRETKSEAYQEHIKNVIEVGILQESRRPNSAQGSKKDNLRARYWSYLFDNLQRAVDEIYKTCDNDESTVECEEMIMMLDSCKKDFVALISRIKMFKEIETTDAKHRPQSLAWEVRKMSPGKCLSPPPTGLMSGGRSPTFGAQKSLNFGLSATTSIKSGSPKCELSWADKVKGLKTTPTESPKSKEDPFFHVDESVGTSEVKSHSQNQGEEKISNAQKAEESSQKNLENIEDDDGWEIVSRGKHRSRGSSTSVSVRTTTSQDSVEIIGWKISSDNNHKEITINTAEAGIGTGMSAFEKVMKSPGSRQSSETILLSRENSAFIGESGGMGESKGACSDIGVLEISEGNSGAGDQEEAEEMKVLAESDTEETIDVLMLEEEMNDLIQADEQQEEDLISIQIEEENKKALASAIEEEEHLTKELEDEALKNMDDMDDTEDISSDKEGTNSDEGQGLTPRDEQEADESVSFEGNASKTLSWEEILAQYDKEEHDRQEGFGWGDLSDAEPSRPPGRALEMHQKLSSPSRRRPRAESVRISKERMMKAERKRLKLLEAKCQRLRMLSENVRKVRVLKNNIIQDQELFQKTKMSKAEQKRKLVLQEKIKKAQEEDAKVNEIAFINSLEAQNKKIEVQEKHQFMEARLQEIMEERQRKREEQQAKEDAAQERRRALEAMRRARLEEIKLKRKEQETKRIKEKQEKERAREEAIRERQRDREMKVAARNEAFEKATEELQKKIEQKQLESSRRHEERIELVKEKAASSSRHATMEEAPSIIPYERKKQCTLCNVEIISEVFLISHLKGRKHRESVREINKKITDVDMEGFSMKYIKESEETNISKQNEREEHQKAMKKRLKKIKSRMNQRGREFEASATNEEKTEESPKRARLHRSLKDINKLLQTQGSTFWPANKITALDRALSEISRLLETKTLADQRVFCQIGGLAVLTRILLLLDISGDKKTTKPAITDKILIHASEVSLLACDGNTENCQYMLLSNKLSTLIDLLNYRLEIPIEGAATKELNESQENVKLKNEDPLVCSLLQTLSSITRMLNVGAKTKKGNSDNFQRISDLVSYIVCCGILDKYHQIFQKIQEPLEDSTTLQFFDNVIQMLQGVVISLVRMENVFCSKKEDPTGILHYFESTHLLGLLSLMYALLHNSGAARISPSPFPLSEGTITILTSVLRLVNFTALLDIHVLQDILGAEGNCLQFRSIANYILRYCSTQNCDDLLSELVVSVGYYTVLNKDNQIFLQTGRAPTILQQLCLLPFSYFSDPKLRNVLLPTLVSCCYESQENKAAIEQEISSALLVSFIEENVKDSKSEEPASSKPFSLSADGVSLRSTLNLRFPRTSYEEAIKFFSLGKAEEGKP